MARNLDVDVAAGVEMPRSASAAHMTVTNCAEAVDD